MNPPLSKLREAIFTVFSPNGPLGLLLKDYELRVDQQEMALDVLNAFEENQAAFIEAGTGIGKSFAYLIPAILWAEKSGERVVISTNTIALQEQLIEKDVPLALKVLSSSLKVVLVKGMQNYVCLRKLHEESSQASLLPDQESEEIAHIAEWSRTTKIGSRSELHFAPLRTTWDKVSVDNDACTHSKCPDFKECFLFHAKKEAQEARIIICNHHLLFADLASRRDNNNYEATAVLPPFQKLILDEAHHTEDVAASYFSAKVSRLELLKLLALLGSDSEASPGKINLLKKMIDKLPDSGFSKKDLEKTALIHKLGVELPILRRELIVLTNDFFDLCLSFLTAFPTARTEEGVGSEQKLRFLPGHFIHPLWQQRIIPKAKLLGQSLTSLVVTLQNIEADATEIKNPRFQDESGNVRIELIALAAKFTSCENRLASFLLTDTREEVRWMECTSLKNNVEVRLIVAKQDISASLREALFQKISATILCSATLATQKRFDYMRASLGVDEEKNRDDLGNKKIMQKMYRSPFSYETQTLLGVPVDLPFPDESKYLQKVIEALFQLVEASHGNAFLLFTSYSMLKNCYDALAEKLTEAGYHPLKHGDAQRHELIRRFKEMPRSVLFGTDSFWEGVDVIGDALRLVVIIKLPFPVPSEPMIQARTETLNARGGKPFIDYMVPKAIVKFKQAFGRLIRHKRDYGCVICLDTRLVKKGYGAHFLNSLPVCYQVFEPLTDLTQKMRRFYSDKRAVEKKNSVMNLERNGIEPFTSTMPLLRSTK